MRFIAKIKEFFNRHPESQFFIALNKLQEAIFIVYLTRDYPSKRHFYEKKLHVARQKIMRVMVKLRRDATPESLVLFERLYEVLFSMNTLKLRIKDHAAFEVAEQDFKRLILTLADILKRFSQKQSVQLLGLQTVIDEFEEINRSALQVISYDPIVFVFFLRDLHSLQQILTELADRAAEHDENFK